MASESTPKTATEHHSKKRKASESDHAIKEEPYTLGATFSSTVSESTPKSALHRSKKRKAPKSTGYAIKEEDYDRDATSEPVKSKRRKRSDAKKLAQAEGTTTGDNPGTTEGRNASSATSGDVKQGKAARFIVFIGNLPFSATKETVAKHFTAVRPKSVRVMTPKEDPSKCKGFAFLDFENYDTMKSCLEKFHHSVFDDGVSDSRKLNVELTAGGGGKSMARRTKLHAKNEKLNDQRRRKAEGRSEVQTKKAAGNETNDIHPSRKKQIK